MAITYIVQISRGVWLAPWDGDPGRTLVKGNAKQFATIGAAQKALSDAIRQYPDRFTACTDVVIQKLREVSYERPTLFEIGTPQTKPLTCRTCIHRERHEMGGSIISYCAIRKSKRTQNGKLKITIKTPACAGFERGK